MQKGCEKVVPTSFIFVRTGRFFKLNLKLYIEFSAEKVFLFPNVNLDYG